MAGRLSETHPHLPESPLVTRAQGQEDAADQDEVMKEERLRSGEEALEQWCESVERAWMSEEDKPISAEAPEPLRGQQLLSTDQERMDLQDYESRAQQE